MNKKIIAFTLHHPHHSISFPNWPTEDAFKFSQGKSTVIAAVADGITRDPIDCPILPDIHKMLGEIEFALEYPIPSPAAIAAETLCKSFISYSKNKTLSKKLARNAFVYANKKIGIVNKGLKCDYLENDFAACVAVGVLMTPKKLHYAFITDCGLAIFNARGEQKFITPLEAPSSAISRQAQKQKTNWRQPEWRAHVRKHYRNNPSEKNSYGALTGEQSASQYIRSGTVSVLSGDSVLLFSDGFHSIISSSSFNPVKFKDNLRLYFNSNKKKIDGGEGTLVAIVPL